jgi:MscS family membrane protein
MEVWVVYMLKSPDFVRHMQVRQKVNFEIMHAVESLGLSFAFPTQTVHVASLPGSASGGPRA